MKLEWSKALDLTTYKNAEDALGMQWDNLHRETVGKSHVQKTNKGKDGRNFCLLGQNTQEGISKITIYRSYLDPD